MRAFILTDGTLRQTRAVSDVRAAHAAKQMMWIDLEAQTPETEALVADFALHPLTVEDIWSERATPKIDEFDEYLYVRVHAVTSPNDVGGSARREVDLVIAPDYVITHDPTNAVAKDLAEDLERTPRLLAKGSAWLGHAVLDRVVDAYLPVIDCFDDNIESLENDVLAKAGTREGVSVLQRILAEKRALQSLRRISIHQRELLLRLARGEFDAIPADALPYFRDVHDHFVRVGDLADSYRDLVTSALDAYLSVQSNRMNQVMKTLTLISTVMLPITFIAGVYGMNFDNMPELHWRYGYLLAVGLMALVAGGAWVWFRYKRWLD
jgi:magnesium transporter